ncbi:hypothetical protein C2G38_2096078 [Gigaspora rosea]|uniref:Uncharacterized protein n=1 Tax=Gigaspora rosea TaxID=44941 RepID=A0A397UVT8_9GLOM|nr:hypothetical protein C2G38_2096078 [Gigaspora rosea]
MKMKCFFPFYQWISISEPFLYYKKFFIFIFFFLRLYALKKNLYSINHSLIFLLLLIMNIWEFRYY